MDDKPYSVQAYFLYRLELGGHGKRCLADHVLFLPVKLKVKPGMYDIIG